ncbi:hypothetical protein [Croceimicrobium hydrocarbonivorans]|uniref:Uncharacterized protein n=1 Tax=Croceimicrobium hydrocarbonivorans TaxID=2761580 RepID=A0A7H0VHB7_9FLAO|nr:hypothetical protein [Croceimicrobium hydrocarbonivorans]QNR25115.1 hypothetical protein H4K34_04560 [Croceimicrobium hydrocarbonivorans]
MAGERLPASLPADKQGFRYVASLGFGRPAYISLRTGRQNNFEWKISEAKPQVDLCKPFAYIEMKERSKVLILLLIGFMVSNAYGTIQTSEYLVIGTDTIMIEEYPLNIKINQDTTLLTRGQKKNADGSFSMCISSGCWRGYIGTWTLINDSLFLINLVPPCELKRNEENPLAIEKLFKNSITSIGVFASWVNDTLNTRCIMLPCDKVAFHFIISNGVVTNKFETINKDWLERHPEYQKPSENEIESETENIELDNSNQYAWYLLIAGIILVILLINKRRLIKAKKS